MARLHRTLLCCGVLALPAVLLWTSGLHAWPLLALVCYGLAVAAASFLLAWAAEAAQADISGGLAIAVLAVIAVLPEYAVDLYFAYSAGTTPRHVTYAAANMTGSNRLLLGLGWSLVVLVSLAVARRRTGRPVHALVLERGHRTELGFLAVASLLAFVIPVSGRIPLLLGAVMLGLFVYYLFRAARAGAEQPDLAGTAASIAALPARRRRVLVIGLFAVSAGIILLCAQPFAQSLIATGTRFGIDRFLLVQWLAPLASEAPEFIVAILFAARGKGPAALGTLISAKVNQYTLLLGSLPIAYLAGGGGFALHLNARQVEEFLLTATQTVLGVAALLALRFSRRTAWVLLVLFAVQFAVPGQTARYVLCALYVALAVAALVRHRRYIGPTLAAPFLPGRGKRGTSGEARVSAVQNTK